LFAATRGSLRRSWGLQDDALQPKGQKSGRRAWICDRFGRGRHRRIGGEGGMAVDPNTGVEATVTELNAQVEF
jgi:hypothetical protein